MHRSHRRAAWAVTIAAVASLGAANLAVAAPAAQAVTGGRASLPSPVPLGITSMTDLGPAGARVSLPIRIYLAGRSAAAEARFATAASTPGQPAYGHYLSPAQFRARFGPTTAQTAAVEAWARSAGLTVTGATSHYVSATGTAPQVGAALDTSIHSYGNNSVVYEYAPAGGMSVPAALSGDVSTVTGMDRAANQSTAAATQQAPAAPGPARAPETTADRAGTSGFTCSDWWGQHVSSIPAADGRTSAPDAVCGYTPQQLSAAYGARPDSGRGATVAVVLDGSLPSMRSDANRFFAAHQLPGFAAGQFTVSTGPGFAASCQGQADVPEEPLDVETAHVIAPAAKIVYVAADCTANTLLDNGQQGLLDAETRVVDQHLGDVATESYSVAETQFSPATAAAWTQVFEQGAAEGIGFDFDSGDGGDNSGQGVGGGTAVTFPASDPWATAVGGTTLQLGRTGTVTGELGWGDTGAQETSDGTGYTQPLPGAFEEGSTGGRSALFPQPAYQRGVVPGSLSTDLSSQPAGREVPDVAADADPVTGWLIGYTAPGGAYRQILEGGTSGAAPIVAALEADAGQAAGHAIGFADPLLYTLRRSAGIRDVTAPAGPVLSLAPNCYADPTEPGPACLITLGLDSSLTVAPGYDDVTGIGAPTSRFVAALADGR